MTSLQMTRPTPNIAWTDTYHNGGVEGAPLAQWYKSEFAAHFEAMDFTADIPASAPTESRPAAQAAPAVEICAGCQLCVDGSLFPEQPASAREPGKTYSCALLSWVRDGVVGAPFAAQVVADAHAMQNRVIDGFMAAMPEHFGTLRPDSVLDAEEHYVQGRALGVEVIKPVRDVAWFHFENYRAYMRQNFESDFLKD